MENYVQIKPKVIRIKDLINIKVEISEMEKSNTFELVTEIKSDSLGRSIKLINL